MFTLLSTHLKNLRDLSKNKEKMSSNPAADDDLTTDACPSPPRDEVENEEAESKNREEYKENHEESKRNSASFSKNNAAPTAFATVINISNSNGVHVGSNYKIYMNKPNKQRKSKNVQLTESVKNMFVNSAPVTTKHLLLVSEHMNENWRDTARILDYSDGQISQFYENHFKTGIKEVIYQLLLDWIQNKPDSATIGRLSTTLWNSNQQDAVQIWCDSFCKS